MVSETAQKSDDRQDILTAIGRARNPAIDPMSDPATVEPIGQVAQIIAHDNYDRDNRLNGHPTDTTNVHGWSRIDRIQIDNGITDSLSMSLWKKGDSTVATVLSVAGVGEGIRNKIGPKPPSYEQAQQKIAEWKAAHPDLILVGHGDKGSTIALAQAKRENLPGIVFAPDPAGLKLTGQEPIVAFDMSASSVTQNQSLRRDQGLVTRMIDGANVAGTGRQVASNPIDKIDMRGYNAAFGIGRATADPTKADAIRDVTQAEQPALIRLLNNPVRRVEQILNRQDIDYRIEQLNHAADDAAARVKNLAPGISAPAPSPAGSRVRLGLDNTPGITSTFSASSSGVSVQDHTLGPAPETTPDNRPAPGGKF